MIISISFIHDSHVLRILNSRLSFIESLILCLMAFNLIALVDAIVFAFILHFSTLIKSKQIFILSHPINNNDRHLDLLI